MPIKTAAPIRKTYSPSIRPFRPIIVPTLWLYESERRRNIPLKARKNRPNTRSITRVSLSFGAEAGRRINAAKAGESVSELKADITVEMAIVMAHNAPFLVVIGNEKVVRLRPAATFLVRLGHYGPQASIAAPEAPTRSLAPD